MKITKVRVLVCFVLFVVSMGCRAESADYGFDSYNDTFSNLTAGDSSNRQRAGKADLVKAAFAMVANVLWRDLERQQVKNDLKHDTGSIVASANYSIDADADKVGLRMTWAF